MGFTYGKTPQQDDGTGEHDVAGPTTYESDDVTGKATGETEPQGESVTYEADSLEPSSTGEHEVAGPTTTNADWPPFGEDKAVKTGEAKSTSKTTDKSES